MNLQNNIVIMTSNFKKKTTKSNNLPQFYIYSNYRLIAFIVNSEEENTINWRTIISPSITNIFLI